MRLFLAASAIGGMLVVWGVIGCQGDETEGREGEQTTRRATRSDGPCSGVSADPGERLVEGRVSIPRLGSERAGEPRPSSDAEGGRSVVARSAPERPARGARVKFYTVDSRGETVNTLEPRTTTTADGRWCVALPTSVEMGVTLVVEATVGNGSGKKALRRSVVTTYGNRTDVRSEALARVFERVGVDWHEVSRATYLNLLAISATAVDLTQSLRWRAGDTISSAIERAERALREDRRLREKLDMGEGEEGPGSPDKPGSVPQ